MSESTTVTVPTELLREFCARVNYPNTPQERLKEVLQAQLPREIEEGCRVKPRRLGVGGYLYGTAGKPFHGHVLVKWDDSDIGRPGQWQLDDLERID